MNLSLVTLIAIAWLSLSSSIMAQPVGPHAGENPDRSQAVVDVTASSPSDSATNFDLVMYAVNSHRWSAVRFDKRRGESWLLSDGNIWKQISEPDGGALVEANYLVKAVTLRDSKCAVLRMDGDSGKTWFLKDSRWLPVPTFSD